AGRQALQEPDVRDGRGQVDVAEALAANLGLDDLDAALLADDPAVLHALVLAAVALVVLHWPEDLRAEQAVPFRLEGPVVDRLGLLHLTVGPLPDLLRRRQRNADRGERQRIFRLLEEVENVFHVFAFLRPFAEPSNFFRTYSPPSSLAADDADALAAAAAALALAATSRAISSSVDSCLRGAFGSSISSTFRQSNCSSLRSTLNDSGKPDSSTCSPLTIASYMRVRPMTSSDFTVRNSCRPYAAPYASIAHTSISPNRCPPNCALPPSGCCVMSEYGPIDRAWILSSTRCDSLSM